MHHLLLLLVVLVALTTLQARPVQPQRAAVEMTASGSGSGTAAAHRSNTAPTRHEIVELHHNENGNNNHHQQPHQQRISYLQDASHQHSDYAVHLARTIHVPLDRLLDAVNGQLHPIVRNFQGSARHAGRFFTGVTHDDDAGSSRRLTTKDRLASGGLGILHGTRAVAHTLEGGAIASQGVIAAPAVMLNHVSQVNLHNIVAAGFSAAHHIREKGSKCIGALCQAGVKVKKCIQGSCTRVTKAVNTAKEKLQKEKQPLPV
jgi:hypothetical protein